MSCYKKELRAILGDKGCLHFHNSVKTVNNIKLKRFLGKMYSAYDFEAVEISENTLSLLIKTSVLFGIEATKAAFRCLLFVQLKIQGQSVASVSARCAGRGGLGEHAGKVEEVEEHRRCLPFLL